MVGQDLVVQAAGDTGRVTAVEDLVGDHSVCVGLTFRPASAVSPSDVGVSFAGAVMGDYAETHGDVGLSGVAEERSRLWEDVCSRIDMICLTSPVDRSLQNRGDSGL